jgi:hypothetical protein
MRTLIHILSICGFILLMFTPLFYSTISGENAPIETSLAK